MGKLEDWLWKGYRVPIILLTLLALAVAYVAVYAVMTWPY